VGRFHYKSISKNTKTHNRVEEGFCVFRNGLISISDWVVGHVWSCSTLFIMKTSHKRDELKKNLKKGGSPNRVPMIEIKKLAVLTQFWEFRVISPVMMNCSLIIHNSTYRYKLFLWKCIWPINVLFYLVNNLEYIFIKINQSLQL
jgi:hypothetical protein